MYRLHRGRDMATNTALDSARYDIHLINGQRARVTGAAQVRQLVISRLKHFSGSWFLNTSSGIPYFQDIFVRPINLPRAELLLIQEINETVGVSELLSFNIVYDRKTRHLLVGFEAVTDIAGETITVNEVGING
jgi:hypothetical protein